MNDSTDHIVRIDRQALLPLSLAGSTAASACAASVVPDKLGAARANWERRRLAAGARPRLTVQVTNMAAGKESVHRGLCNADTAFPLRALTYHQPRSLLPAQRLLRCPPPFFLDDKPSPHSRI